MPTNVRQVAADIRRWRDVRVRDAFVERMGGLATLLHRKFFGLTPIDSGFARSRWRIVRGRGGLTGFGGGNFGGGTAVGLSAPSSFFGIGAIEPGDDLTIINDAPHIRVLDEGGFVPPNPGPSRDPRPGRRGRILVSGGFSTQAPDGIVLVAIRDARVFLSAA